MYTVNSSLNLLIGNDIGRTASVLINDRSSASYLADGEIVCLDNNDAILPAGATLSDSPFIRIVQRSGTTARTSELISSLRIDGRNVVSFTGASYSAPQEQIYRIGYPGTGTENINAINSNAYTLRFQYKHDKEIWSQQSRIKSYYYTSDASATAEEIARNFAVLVGNDTDSDVLAERLCNDAGVALAGGATLTVTNNSKEVTISVADPAIVVGSYLRINGTAVTTPIYRVTAVSGTSITLDERYQRASGTAIAGEQITAALATAAIFGITFEGKALTFTVGKFKYNRVAFDLALTNFGTTVITKTQEALLGRGVYEQIAELEYFAQGFDGIIDRVGDSSPTLRADATSGETYDVIYIKWFDTSDQSIISGTKPSPNECMLAVPDGAAQTVNILAQLNPWMASLPRTFAAVSV